MSTIVRRLVGAPPGLNITARLRDGDEILSTVVTVAPILDRWGHALAAYMATFELPTDLPVLLEFLQDGVPLDGPLLIDGSPDDPAPAPGQFASLTDLAVIQGLVDETAFSPADAARGELLLALASGVITDAVGRDDVWAVGLSPIPTILRAVCLEAARRVMNNPSGARSEAETLGQYQHSVSWTDDAHSVLLTPAEIALCRRAVNGMTSGSARLESIVTVLAHRPAIETWIGDGDQ